MERINAESEVLTGLAGRVRYYTRKCPYNVEGIHNVVPTVGSTACKICRHFIAIGVNESDNGVEAGEFVDCGFL